MNNQELLFIGWIGKISRKKRVVFLNLAGNVFWKPEKNNCIFIRDTRYFIESYGLSNKGFSLKLSGVNDLDALFGMVGAEVFAAKADFSVESYSSGSLIGCEVRTLKGDLTGCISEVFKTPAGSILEVSLGSKICLIPFKKEFIKHIDTGSKKIVIDPVDGMV